MAQPKVGLFWDYRSGANGCCIPKNMTTSEAIGLIHQFTSIFGTTTTFKVYLGDSESASPDPPSPRNVLSELYRFGVVATSNDNPVFGLATMLTDLFSFFVDNGPSATAVVITGDAFFSYGISLLSFKKYRVVVATPQPEIFPCQALKMCGLYSDLLFVGSNDSARRESFLMSLSTINEEPEHVHDSEVETNLPILATSLSTPLDPVVVQSPSLQKLLQLKAGTEQTTRKRRVKAKWPYNQDQKVVYDLSFAANDIIELIEESSAHWWTGCIDGKEGAFPASYVEVFHDEPSSNISEKTKKDSIIVSGSVSDDSTPKPPVVELKVDDVSSPLATPAKNDDEEVKSKVIHDQKVTLVKSPTLPPCSSPIPDGTHEANSDINDSPRVIMADKVVQTVTVNNEVERSPQPLPVVPQNTPGADDGFENLSPLLGATLSEALLKDADVVLATRSSSPTPDSTQVPPTISVVADAPSPQALDPNSGKETQDPAGDKESLRGGSSTPTAPELNQTPLPSLGDDPSPLQAPVVETSAQPDVPTSSTILPASVEPERVSSEPTVPAEPPITQPNPIVRSPPLAGKFAPLLWAIERNLSGESEVSFDVIKTDVEKNFPGTFETVGATSFEQYINLACEANLIVTEPGANQVVKFNPRFHFLLRALLHFLQSGISPVQRSVLQQHLEEMAPTYLTSGEAKTLGHYAQIAAEAKLVTVSKGSVELAGSSFSPALPPSADMKLPEAALVTTDSPPSTPTPSRFYHLIRVMGEFSGGESKLDYSAIEKIIEARGHAPHIYALVGVKTLDEYLTLASRAKVVEVGTETDGNEKWARLNPHFYPLLVGIAAFISRGSDRIPRMELEAHLTKSCPKYLSLCTTSATLSIKGFAEYIQLADSAMLIEILKKKISLLGT